MMSKNDEARQQAGEALQRAGSVAVIAHVRPDGDAAGALTGLGLALKAAGEACASYITENKGSTNKVFNEIFNNQGDENLLKKR